MPKLFIVPTPIGNLEDITLRALNVLKSCDFICAEDTRVTNNLLQHFNIQKPLMSYHNFNEHDITERIINRITNGETCALVSDCGTPGLSDPGFLLIRSAIQHGIGIDALPGPVAFIPALLQSGFPIHPSLFYGFLPHKKGRRSQLMQLSALPYTIIFYESPFRLVRLLQEIRELFGKRRVSVSRELTKKFEETIRGSVDEVIHHFETNEPRGEIIVVVEGLSNKSKKEHDESPD
jgi:16S rRNA (cytidine1402-2'-O)-methyltransferase